MSDLKLENGNDVLLPQFVDESFQAHWAPDGFTNEQHHSSYDTISSSGLGQLIKSPFNYLENLKKRQNGKPMPQTRSMKFGTIAHLIVLEPAEFRRRVVLAPSFDMRTTKGKEDFKLFQLDQHPDAIIYKSNDEDTKKYEELVGVVNAIANHEKARDIFKVGVTEQTGFYRCELTGLKKRFRPDFMSTGNEITNLVDFKTTKSVIYEHLQKTIESYNYHVQIYFYREGYKALFGKYPDVTTWVFVENTFPFEVAIHTADEPMLEFGKKWHDYSMMLLKECIQAKYFPQKQRKVEQMVPSDYSMNKIIPNIVEVLWGN